MNKESETNQGIPVTTDEQTLEEYEELSRIAEVEGETFSVSAVINFPETSTNQISQVGEENYPLFNIIISEDWSG